MEGVVDMWKAHEDLLVQSVIASDVPVLSSLFFLPLKYVIIIYFWSELVYLLWWYNVFCVVHI